jgi:hypothetical protein
VELAKVFPMARAHAMERPFLDHTMLMWESGEGTQCGTYFKFERAWLLEEGFKSLVENKWKDMHPDGSAAAKLEAKHLELKRFLKEYRKQLKEEQTRLRDEALAKIQKLDGVENLGQMTDSER